MERGGRCGPTSALRDPDSAASLPWQPDALELLVDPDSPRSAAHDECGQPASAVASVRRRCTTPGGRCLAGPVAGAGPRTPDPRRAAAAAPSQLRASGRRPREARPRSRHRRAAGGRALGDLVLSTHHAASVARTPRGAARSGRAAPPREGRAAPRGQASILTAGSALTIFLFFLIFAFGFALFSSAAPAASGGRRDGFALF